MEKILPLNREVVYGGMCRDMNRLIAITASKHTLPWYVNNFISQIMYETFNVHCYETDNSYEVFDVYDEVAEFNFLKIKNNDLTMVIDALRNNEYVLVNWDRYFVKESSDYKKNHVYHEALIFGYNSQEETLNFHDSLINGKDFDVGKIKYSDFLDSVHESLNVISELEAVHWQYAFNHPFSRFKVKEAPFKINLRKIFHKFYTELRGYEMITRFPCDDSSKNFKGGIKIMDGFYELLKAADLDYKMLNEHSNALWSIKLMSEHVKSHEIRFKYLFENGLAIEDPSIYQIINSLSKKMMVLFFFAKKYSMFNSNKDIKRCIELFESIQIEYRNMLEVSVGIMQEAIEREIA